VSAARLTLGRLALGLTLVLSASFIAACGARDEAAVSDSARSAADGTSPIAGEQMTDTVVIQEAWVTPLDSLDNVDGPAIWFSADGPRVIASAKSTDVLIVYDALTGRPLRRVSAPGTGEGQLRRPNGVLVLGDSLLLVVERDNHRVQGFTLPDFKSAGTFGASDLRLPYGLTAYQPSPDRWRVYVTDNYETVDEQVPPRAELGSRIKWYDVTVRGGRLSATLGGAFGDTTEAGAIRVTESIQVDPVRERLMIAEEDEADTQIKEYTLDGRFTGRRFGRGIFRQQAEGIALYTCGDSAGYWVTTDQGDGVNVFHLFDRETLAHVGHFTGAITRRTDGVALTQRQIGPHAGGLFFAAHVDAGIAALPWREVSQTLKLSCDSTAPVSPTTARP